MLFWEIAYDRGEIFRRKKSRKITQDGEVHEYRHMWDRKQREGVGLIQVGLAQVRRRLAPKEKLS